MVLGEAADGFFAETGSLLAGVVAIFS